MSIQEAEIGDLPKTLVLRRSDGDVSDPASFYCQLDEWEATAEELNRILNERMESASGEC